MSFQKIGQVFLQRQSAVNFRETNQEERVIIEHRRRIYTEAKAKVVASVWGQNLLNSLLR